MSSTGPPGGHGPNSSGGVASQLHGHSQYAKGAVVETFGKLTGAAGLQSTGKADQTAGWSEIRQAKQQSGSEAPGPVSSTSKSDTTVSGSSSS